MADLSQLFGGVPQAQGRRNPFALSAPHANNIKRRIVMREAMKQDLAPEDGDDFFQFVGNRLFELGDTEGAFAVQQQRQQMQAQQAGAKQQAFANQLALNQDRRAESQLSLAQQAANQIQPPKSRTIRRGTKQITQEFNSQTGQFEDIAEGAAFAPPNNININTGSDLGNEIAAIEKDPNLDPNVKAQLIDAKIDKATETGASRAQATMQGNIAELDKQLTRAITELESAGEALRADRSVKNMERYQTARKAAVIAGAGRLNFRGEPSDVLLKSMEEAIPTAGSLMAADTVGHDLLSPVTSQLKRNFDLNGDDKKAAAAQMLNIDPSRIKSIEIVE